MLGSAEVWRSLCLATTSSLLCVGAARRDLHARLHRLRSSRVHHRLQQSYVPRVLIWHTPPPRRRLYQGMRERDPYSLLLLAGCVWLSVLRGVSETLRFPPMEGRCNAGQRVQRLRAGLLHGVSAKYSGSTCNFLQVISAPTTDRTCSSRSRSAACARWHAFRNTRSVRSFNAANV
jgi:hypothetical protein